MFMTKREKWLIYGLMIGDAGHGGSLSLDDHHLV